MSNRANSLVNKDIEPYAIYGGVPARFIKWRFEKEIREELLELKWWNLNDNQISELKEGFAISPITLDIIKKIRRSINNE